jgi:hypothetical protein
LRPPPKADIGTAGIQEYTPQCPDSEVRVILWRPLLQTSGHWQFTDSGVALGWEVRMVDSRQ